jgi:phosphoribosyl-ATP pyrophosphohydrolase
LLLLAERDDNNAHLRRFIVDENKDVIFHQNVNLGEVDIALSDGA